MLPDSPIIAIGAVAERSHLGPLIFFVFVWSTLVYDVIACWTWNPHGWSYVLGGLDFAGGTPVHISSGTAALAISIYLGKRRGYGTERLAYKPHNTSYVVLGTVFLWFGWFGFNGGSALSSNLRAVQACIVTNLAASVGGLTWMLWVCFFQYPDHILLSNSTFRRITVLRRSGQLSASARALSLVSSRSLPLRVMSVLVSFSVLPSDIRAGKS
jgi:ammonia channel protein AmtB